ncbi:MAG: DUF5032 domain-containing protein [Parabacteroides sp.]|nr:DUF5032 domain-containing protein [Parabacteroides sp.]
MKKNVFLILILVIGLVSCGDDDKPVVAKMNKLTKVTCKKNGTEYPDYSLDISYNQDGNVSKIVTSRGTFNLIYTGNKVSVINGSNMHTEDFQLSGKVVLTKDEWAVNEYVPNEEYIKNQYNYKYSGSNLSETDWVFQRPLEEGGYKKNTPVSVDKYTWQNGNVVTYAYLPRDEVSYTYATQVRPENFPFRVVNTLQPVTPDLVSPLNTLYGTMNRYLPVSASRYQLGESKESAEYSFSYMLVGDYVTGMTIREKISGSSDETTYEYAFTYNYEEE